MANQQAETLYKKYLAGNCTQEERALVEQWYLNEADKRRNDHLNINDEDIKASMWAELEQQTTPGSARSSVRNWYPYAAAIVLLLFGLGLFYKYEPVAVVKTPQTLNDIKPGRNTATLTLSNGEKIILSDAANGELARQAGVVIHKSADGHLIYDLQPAAAEMTSGSAESKNILTTARGEEYQLILPDGSKVWLNSASSLRFPAEFKGTERNVELTGEAYFEIAKVKKKPFIVKIRQVKVEVLGTHFNVMSYQDEGEIKTTLLEGAVKIASGNTDNVLKPGEQAIVDPSNKIQIRHADTEQAVAWKDGYFKFNKQDIRYIMRQLARWYDIDVVYEGEIPADLFVGKIRRRENITEVLKIFELSQIKYQIKGRKIIIKS